MKNIIIIGAGISGLTAGIYACESGFNVTIYESHYIPGGASTSFKRKGYLFEGGMHWLTGSSPKTSLNKIWKETGALCDDTNIYNKDPFFSYEYENQTAYLYRDINKLQSHFIELSPEDEREIKNLCKDLKKFTKIMMPIADIKGVKVKKKAKSNKIKIFSMIPAFMRMSFYGSQTSKEYAKRYKSKLLQKVMRNIVGDETSAIGLMFTLATLASGDGGYPEGGSLAMASRMEKKFLSLGGKIKYNMQVDKVIVKNGIATGVLVKDAEIVADAVIVTQDTLVAIDKLFENPIREPWAEKMRKEVKPMLNTFISLGVKADLSHLPESVMFHIDAPFYCGNEKIQDIGINNYAIYKGYAPKGCTAITSIIMGDSYDFWKEKKENGTYQIEKKKLAESFIEALSQKYPEICDKVEVWDVATPLTYERYLHSFKGSWMSIMGKGSKMEDFPSKPENIKNLYFAGQRLMLPGGLPVAAETGRKAVQYLCVDTNTVFQGDLK